MVRHVDASGGNLVAWALGGGNSRAPPCIALQHISVSLPNPQLLILTDFWYNSPSGKPRRMERPLILGGMH
jgi:hypothetical protein